MVHVKAVVRIASLSHASSNIIHSVKLRVHSSKLQNESMFRKAASFPGSPTRSLRPCLEEAMEEKLRPPHSSIPQRGDWHNRLIDDDYDDAPQRLLIAPNVRLAMHREALRSLAVLLSNGVRL